MSSSTAPSICHPPMTSVSFQHPVIGLVRGVISRSYFTASRNISTHPDGLAYVIDVPCPNRGTIRFVKQPSDISVIEQ
jgi:hypothetical protein